jgi:predicted metal-binding protein
MRKIAARVDETTLAGDMEKYRKLAIEWGATDARTLHTDQLVIDERVPLKCGFPKCGTWGKCVHCPPHAMPAEQTAKLVSQYRMALLYTFECPSSQWLGADVDVVARRNRQREIHDLCTRLETAAFHDGYHLAMGFWNGSCKHSFCRELDCSALEPGKGCRVPLKARSSMEAVGFDPMVMAARQGWDIYPCGSNTQPQEVPFVRFLGLVLVD